MFLLSFVLCIMHPIVSCQAARATGLLSYAIINSLAVSTDHWFPTKTAVTQNPRQVPKPPHKTATRDRQKLPAQSESEKPPNWAGKPRNWQHWLQLQGSQFQIVINFKVICVR